MGSSPAGSGGLGAVVVALVVRTVAAAVIVVVVILLVVDVMVVAVVVVVRVVEGVVAMVVTTEEIEVVVVEVVVVVNVVVELFVPSISSEIGKNISGNTFLCEIIPSSPLQITLLKSLHCLGLTFPNLWMVWQPLPVCAFMASLVLKISIEQYLKPPC